MDIASIPGHIEREGRDDERPADEEPPWPWLRLSVNQGTVILDRTGAELVHRSLGQWLEAVGDQGAGR